MAIYRNYERQDFSYLLKTEKKSENVLSNTKYINAEAENVIQKNYKKARQDKLSNQAMKYAYSNFNHIYHDRECGAVKNISDNEFEMTKEFSDNYKWCKNCYRLAIIRYGIDKDGKLFDQYVKYFKLVRASTELLHFLIVENNAKLWIVSSNIMEFKVNEDRWRVSKRDGRLTLLHNNYHINNSGKRVFEKSFHIQFENAKGFRSCVNQMVSYSWDGHITKYNENKKNAKEKKRRTEIQNEVTNNAFIENYMYIKSFYIFSEKLIYLDSVDYIADDYFIKYHIKIKFLDEYIVPNSKYRWVVCKLPKKYLTRFSKAMRKTGRKMFSVGNYDYFDILKNFICFK